MIYVITGLMASGKSTVAELLAKRFPKAVHLRGDVFRKMMVSGREEMSAAPSDEAVRQLNLRYRMTADAAKAYHKAGFTVVAQDNYYGEKLPYFVDLLKPHEAAVFVLCPSPEVIRQREQQRSKTGYAGFDPRALYDGFMRDTPRVGVWIDSSSQTPEQTVETILREI